MQIQFLLNRIYRRLSKIDNAVVVSFPKAGRTWLRLMLDQAGIFVHYTHAGADHRHCIHMDNLPQIKEKIRNKRVLFMIRDPRDTAVSGYFQASKRLNIYHGQLHDFIRDPHHGIEKIIRFNLAWLDAAASFRAFSLISYEQLHADTARELERACHFLSGKKMAEHKILKAVEYGRFENMRALESSSAGNANYGGALNPGSNDDQDSFKTRRGKAGGWHDYFSSDDEAYANTILKKYDYAGRIEEALGKFRN